MPDRDRRPKPRRRYNRIENRRRKLLAIGCLQRCPRGDGPTCWAWFRYEETVAHPRVVRKREATPLTAHPQARCAL
jgi:hypothetical protein